MTSEQLIEIAEKLHPCYCGGEIKIEKVPQNGGMDGTYWNWELFCSKCGLTKTYAADNFYGRREYKFEEVIDDWNKKGRPEPKTGHWEYNQYDCNPNIGNWHCSECRNIVSDMPTCMGKPLYEFCPNCGYPMEIER